METSDRTATLCVLVPGDLVPTSEVSKHPVATRVTRFTNHHLKEGKKAKNANGENGDDDGPGRAASTSADLRAGDLVLCVVTRITQRAAFVSVRTRRGRRLAGDVHGIIRLEDMRARDAEKASVEESYRPGDVVLAKVMAMPRSGAGRFNVRLSTAGERLGCVMGKSYASMFVLTPRRPSRGDEAAGSSVGAGSSYEKTASGGHILKLQASTLSPQSWDQMRCVQTGFMEKRKVARPMHHK